VESCRAVTGTALAHAALVEAAVSDAAVSEVAATHCATWTNTAVAGRDALNVSAVKRA